METQNQPMTYNQQQSVQTQMEPVISVKEWMITILLLAIPLVNIIMLLIWAFGGGVTQTKANYSKATLLWLLIGIGIYVLFFLLIFGLIFSNA